MGKVIILRGRKPPHWIIDLNDTMEAIVIVNRARKGLLEPLKIPEKPYDVLCHQIVSLLMWKSRWSLKEIYDIFSKAYPYRSVKIRVWVSSKPRRIRGGHVIFRVSDGVEEIDVAVYQPTGRFRSVIEKLDIGDEVEVNIEKNKQSKL